MWCGSAARTRACAEASAATSNPPHPLGQPADRDGAESDFDLCRLCPVYAIFFQQLISTKAREEFSDSPDHVHRVLAILDEFWALGEHKVLADAVALIRSQGLRMRLSSS
jgi:hypothetical protein